jgi:hypothetical protein
MKHSVRTTVGMVIAVLLALADVTLPLAGDGRPLPIALAGFALGVLTMVGVVLYALGHRRAGAPVVVVTRLLSAVVTLPTVLMSGVSPGNRLAAAAVLFFTAITVGLLGPTVSQLARTPQNQS